MQETIRPDTSNYDQGLFVTERTRWYKILTRLKGAKLGIVAIVLIVLAPNTLPSVEIVAILAIALLAGFDEFNAEEMYAESKDTTRESATELGLDTQGEVTHRNPP